MHEQLSFYTQKTKLSQYKAQDAGDFNIQDLVYSSFN